MACWTAAWPTLDAVVDGLASGLGPGWKNTVVLIATEFGRTARINGTRGTDHGTASTALILGGGLKKGGIVGDWPTLKDGKLFEGRDTAPTLDMRGLFKGVLTEQFGLDRRVLDSAVFPDSGQVAPVQASVLVYTPDLPRVRGRSRNGASGARAGRRPGSASPPRRSRTVGETGPGVLR